MKNHKLHNDCATCWNSTFIMMERLYEQRIPVQAVLNDEETTRPAQKKTLAMKNCQWDLMEQLIPMLRPLAKATKMMCGQEHVGLSFIYPVLLNLVHNTLTASETDLVVTRKFKEIMKRELTTRFKLQTDGLAVSVPTTACMLDPRFKQLQFLPENVRAHAWEHLTQLLSPEDGGEQAGATAGDDH